MTIRVVVRQAADAWEAEVPDFPGVQTFSRRREDLEANVREALAVFLNVDDVDVPTFVLESVASDATD